MHPELRPPLSVASALTPGPIDPGVTIVLLTDEERRHLLSVVGSDDTGPAATARLKLKSACPVRDAALRSSQGRGLRGFLTKLLSMDGRESGVCRWCEKRERIDHFGLCARCLPRDMVVSSNRSPNAGGVRPD